MEAGLTAAEALRPRGDSGGVFLADVDVGDGRHANLRCEGGVVTEVGRRLRPSVGDASVECAGGRVLHGLHDHHVHLAAAAARRHSFDFAAVTTLALAAQLLALETYAGGLSPGAWVRAVGFDEARSGWVDRPLLDRALPSRPARIQHRSGHAWLANTAATRTLPPEAQAKRQRQNRDLPEGWAADDATDWGEAARVPLDISGVGAQLASYGVTSLTDATPELDSATIASLAAARTRNELPQQLSLMCHASNLPRPLQRGPLKLMLSSDPEVAASQLTDGLGMGSRYRRSVALHCVTEEQLLLSITAFDQYGVLPGDRIEHASVVPAHGLAELRRLGLRVATQPFAVVDRGDIAVEDGLLDENDVYRLGSLLTAGIEVRAGSDLPFGQPDPWMAMRAAMRRVTRREHHFGGPEQISISQALALFAGWPAKSSPADPVEIGDPANLCVLRTGWPVGADDLSGELVLATIADGRIAFQR